MIIHRIFNFCKKVVKHFFKLDKREVEFKKWIETTKNDEMYITLEGFGDVVELYHLENVLL